jgi:TOMM system kinase/cyclase fusion protein
MPEHDPPSIIASRYRVLEEIGRGNVGRVFRVEHIHTGEMLALKLLFARAEADPGLVERFKREARAPALIKSEHVVRITDADVAPELGGAPFFVMELLVGTDLEQYALQRGKLDPDEVVGILGQAARALDKAHAIGIVHRDLKPGNIFLHSDDAGLTVKVLDFGISKIGPVEAPNGEAEKLGITAAGTVMGTPLYMPPEQALARTEILPAADIWAIGMIAYRLLTGVPYWTASTMAELMIAIVRDPLTSPSARAETLPPSFDSWFARSCSREASQRWPTVGRQVVALAEALGVPPPELGTLRSPRVVVSPFDGTQPSAAKRPAPILARGRATLNERPRGPSLTPGSADASGPPSTEGERRQITVLSCEAHVATTDGSEEIDPEDLAEVMREYHTACASVFQGMGGPVAQTMGDGLLVYFGYPTAQGDDARRAVTSGLRIAEAVARIDARASRERHVRVRVAVGIHTGLVVAAESTPSSAADPRSIVGQAPRIASQMKRQAPPDGVVISGATARLVRQYFVTESLGQRAIEGAAHETEIFLAKAENAAIDETMQVAAAPIIGRDAELGVLLDQWEQLKAGSGHVVQLSGEAGIGKSRVLRALKDALREERVTWLESRCSPYFQSTPLHPIVELLNRRLHTETGDTPEIKKEKLAAAVSGYGLDADALPLLAALLSIPLPSAPPLNLSPQRQRQRTHESILALFFAMAAREPLVFVVDDLHWVDPSTLELLGILVDHGPATGILTILTARPEFASPWSSRSHLTQVSLGRLPRPRIEKLVLELAKGKPLPHEVVDQLVTKTDGVPLFVEELARMVLESGLVRELADRWELTAPLPPLAIPTTLRDSLAARLDRLGEVKATAQLAATIGREFSYELLRAVSPLTESQLEAQLHKLVEGELVYQRRLPPHRAFVFKHQLVQEAAYESLLKNARRQYHAKIGDVLTKHFPAVVAEQPETLAHHYAAAGLPAQAVEWLMRAGQIALVRSANAEAIAHLTKALDLVSSLPDTPERGSLEAAVRTVLGVPVMLTKGYGSPEVEKAYARVRELKKVGTSRELLPVLWGLWIFYHVRANYRAAYELTDQLLALADRDHDSDARLCAHIARGSTSVLIGELDVAQDHLERAIALYDPALHRGHAHMFGQDPGMFARVMLAWTLWPLGRFDQAARCAEEAIILARGLSHPNSLGFALGLAGAVDQNRGDVDATARHGAELVTVSAEQGFPHWLGLGHVLSGWAKKERGEHAAGIEEIAGGRATWKMIGARVADSQWDCILAESLTQAGRPDEARAVLDACAAFIEESNERFYEPEVHRLRAEITMATTRDAAEAEKHLLRGLELAKKWGAKAHELRAATSLCAVWRDQGRRDEARNVLGGAYAQIKEGLGTGDMKRAKTLLALDR